MNKAVSFLNRQIERSVAHFVREMCQYNSIFIGRITRAVRFSGRCLLAPLAGMYHRRADGQKRYSFSIANWYLASIN